jgi:hypothetical protein
LKLGICRHQSVGAHVTESGGQVGEEDEVFDYIGVSAVADKAEADEAKDPNEPGDADPRPSV